MLHFRVLFPARLPHRQSPYLFWKGHKNVVRRSAMQLKPRLSSLRDADLVHASPWPWSPQCSADTTCLNRVGSGWWVWIHVDRHMLKWARCLIQSQTSWWQCKTKQNVLVQQEDINAAAKGVFILNEWHHTIVKETFSETYIGCTITLACYQYWLIKCLKIHICADMTSWQDEANMTYVKQISHMF